MCRINSKSAPPIPKNAIGTCRQAMSADNDESVQTSCCIRADKNKSSADSCERYLHYFSLWLSTLLHPKVQSADRMLQKSVWGVYKRFLGQCVHTHFRTLTTLPCCVRIMFIYVLTYCLVLFGCNMLNFKCFMQAFRNNSCFPSAKIGIIPSKHGVRAGIIPSNCIAKRGIIPFGYFEWAI